MYSGFVGDDVMFSPIVGCMAVCRHRSPGSSVVHGITPLLRGIGCVLPINDSG